MVAIPVEYTQPGIGRFMAEWVANARLASSNVCYVHYHSFHDLNARLKGNHGARFHARISSHSETYLS
jgi:hypothetical protein